MTFWTITRNDIKITVRDKMFFFWLLGFPLIFSLIFGMAFRETSMDEKVSLNILDQDGSFLSRAVIRELEAEKYATQVLESEDDKAFRTLIIPPGFAENVLAGIQTELVIEQEKGRNMEAMQSAYSHILKVVVKVITKIVKLADSGENIASRFDELELERRITLRSEMGGSNRRVPSGFDHSVPAMAVIFLLFNIFMYGGINILQERRQGILERTFLSPATFGSMIMGKWISRIFLGMLQLLLLFLAGRLIFGIYLGPSLPALALISLIFCGAISAMCMLFGSIFKKEEMLIVFNILLANIMAALGGCWWPLEIVPKGLRLVGFAFPTGWIMDAYHKLIFFGTGMVGILPHIAALSGFTAVFLILAIRFFKISK